MRVFAFLDITHPPTAWAVMRGMLVSADQVPGHSTSCASFMFAGIVLNQRNDRLRNESSIESARIRSHRQCISRLRGMYFFEQRELAQKAIDQGWGAHFRQENLVELDLLADSQITRADADWISFAHCADDETWMDQYWLGRPLTSSPTWEIIANGVAIVLDTNVRRKAYELAQRVFPKSWIMIEMSRLAGEAGSDGGLITPLVHSVPDDKLRLSYVGYDRAFHEENVIKRMRVHPDFGRLYHRWQRCENIVLPDFSHWTVEFTFEQHGVNRFGDSVLSVHHDQA